MRVLACSLVLLLGGVTAADASAVFREVHGEHRRVRVEDGTPFSASVGRFVSHGCIRLRQEDIRELFGFVKPGTAVNIVYLPVKVAVTPAGEIWVEAHPDVYGAGAPTAASVTEVLAACGLLSAADEAVLFAILQDRLGVARTIGTVPRRAMQDAGHMLR